jgi:hypothetical protein
MKASTWKLFYVVLMLAVAVGGFATGLTVVAQDAYAYAHCNCQMASGCYGCLISGQCVPHTWHTNPPQVCPQPCE